MMLKYVPKDAVVLEIGPGAGRWTKELQAISRRLIIADINDKCLSICRERFKQYNNIEYYLIKMEGNEFIPGDIISDDSIDAIWSYDVFVHINATDIEKYLVNFKRILKPRGYAIIHHAGTYANDTRPATRSFIDGRFVAKLVEKHDMVLVEQNTSLPHMPRDVISVITKKH
jgi:ubiquinone/menaquinone biosynthesis C-methylase UbiE